MLAVICHKLQFFVFVLQINQGVTIVNIQIYKKNSKTPWVMGYLLILLKAGWHYIQIWTPESPTSIQRSDYNSRWGLTYFFAYFLTSWISQVTSTRKFYRYPLLFESSHYTTLLFTEDILVLVFASQNKSDEYFHFH